MFLLENESIQGVIYRAHVLNGIDNFSNIIDGNGRLTGLPRVLIGTEHIFIKIGVKNTLSILKRQRLAPLQEHRLDSPAKYLSYLRCFFRMDKVKKVANDTLHYCVHCARDDIMQYGFATIKLNWVGFNYCNIHEQPLRFVPPISRPESLRCLEIILRGEIPPEHSGCFAQSNYKNFYKREEIKFQVSFASCLYFEFVDFIKKERTSFGKYVCDFDRFSLLSPKITDGFWMKRYIIENVFYRLRNKEKVLFSNFLKQHAQKIRVDCSIFDNNVIRERMLKNKNVRCNECSSKYCPVKHADLNSDER